MSFSCPGSVPALPAHTVPTPAAWQSQNKKAGLRSHRRGFSRLCLPALLLGLCVLLHPAKLTSHKPQRSPWPAAASDNDQQHPHTSSNAMSVAWTDSVFLCPAQLLASAGVISIIVASPGSICPFIWYFVNISCCVQGSPRSMLWFSTGAQPRDQAGCSAELLGSAGSKPFLPARLSRLLQEMVGITSGVPLEILLCS